MLWKKNGKPAGAKGSDLSRCGELAADGRHDGFRGTQCIAQIQLLQLRATEHMDKIDQPLRQFDWIVGIADPGALSF